MKNLDFEWLTDEFMLYCRSTQLREKTMSSYEQTLHLFGRWLSDELKIYTVDKITENVIRKYIDYLMVRGKYTFYVNDLSKKKNCSDRRRDYRKPVSVTTINNYMDQISHNDVTDVGQGQLLARVFTFNPPIPPCSAPTTCPP